MRGLNKILFFILVCYFHISSIFLVLMSIYSRHSFICFTSNYFHYFPTLYDSTVLTLATRKRACERANGRQEPNSLDLICRESYQNLSLCVRGIVYQSLIWFENFLLDCLIVHNLSRHTTLGYINGLHGCLGEESQETKRYKE